MSDDRVRDDDALGAALGRAIDSQRVGETPFDRSRLAQRLEGPRRAFPWAAVAAAGALVASIAFAVYVAMPRTSEEPQVAGPTATPAPTTAPSPTQTSGPIAVAPDFPMRVYFARDGLPPVAGTVRVAPPTGSSPEARILARVGALLQARPGDVPAGAFTAVVVKPAQSGGTGTSARVNGDLVTLGLWATQGWMPMGSSGDLAFLQQVVYTATEEPGIRRVLLQGERGEPFQLGHTIADKPLTREDLSSYDLGRSASEVIADGERGVRGEVADFSSVRWSVDEVSPGLARMVVEVRGVPAGHVPAFDVSAATITDPNVEAKWRLRLHLPEVLWVQPAGQSFHCCPLLEVGRTPLRRIVAVPVAGGNGNDRDIAFDMQLDDLRPWRVAVLQDPLRIVVDVGGTPNAVSDSIAVNSPVASSPTYQAEVARQFTVTGLARTFEAHVSWRVRSLAPGNSVVIASGFTTASIGTAALWGTFEAPISLPAGFSGDAQLEVYWPSPRDGSDLGTVRIPIHVR